MLCFRHVGAARVHLRPFAFVVVHSHYVVHLHSLLFVRVRCCPFAFVVVHSHSLLSVRLRSSSASFIGAVNLAKKEVVGDTIWIVRERVTHWGTSHLSSWELGTASMSLSHSGGLAMIGTALLSSVSCSPLVPGPGSRFDALRTPTFLDQERGEVSCLHSRSRALFSLSFWSFSRSGWPLWFLASVRVCVRVWLGGVVALGYTVFAAFTVLVALNEPGYVVVASW